ncbi:hypothetical protein AB7714_28260 [Tardiphaga sp. 1201_B9_N1_1]|uniref:hypothetical protein n=1 Tax=unclassified Tardiphaga TaxID=2631404 RepID=UPI003F2855EF
MTFQIAKSAIDRLPYVFEDEVKAFIAAKEAHRTGSGAAPTSYPDVEAAVRLVRYPITEGESERPDDFVADFEIVDDTPPPPTSPTPAEKRVQLLNSVRTAQAEAAAKVISPARARLLSLDMSRVYAKQEENRTPADDAAMAQHAAIQSRLNALNYHTATLEVQIEDLADDQLDGWQMTAFPAV